MATPYFTSDSLSCNPTDSSNLPEFNFDPNIRVTLCDGQPAEVYYESGRYYVKPLGADLPYCFNTFEAFKAFQAAHLSNDSDTEPEPPVPASIIAFRQRNHIELREEVSIAAVAAPTTEHVIHLAQMVNAPADVTDCESCREALPAGTDGALCPTCDSTSAAIITDPADRLYELRNALRRLFTEKISNDEYKVKRAAILDEIAALEAQVKAQHIGYGTSSHYYHSAINSIDTAIAEFTKRYGRKPNQMRISKYDSADPIEGIEISRAAAVLPGDLWLGAR